jgi:hypothetical protein
MRWAGHVARMGEERKVYRVLVEKPEGKRPLGRLKRRWEDGIRMEIKETGWGCVDWIRLAEDRDRWRAVVNALMNLRVLATRSYLLSQSVSQSTGNALIEVLFTFPGIVYKQAYFLRIFNPDPKYYLEGASHFMK